MAILLPGSVLGIYATNTGMGKALAHGTKVMTPSGPVNIEDIKVGDMVSGRDGRPTKVIAVYPQGEKRVHRITFTDDTTVDCCEDHLWAVRSSGMKCQGKPFRVFSVKQLLALETLGQGMRMGNGFRHAIPFVDPIQFEPTPTPIDPYVMGALLGDGGFTTSTISFTNTDSELLDQIRNNLPDTTKLAGRKSSHIQFYLHQNKEIYRPHQKGNLRNDMRTALRDLGLLGKGSRDKFVPDIYKFGSVEQRTALLQGFMDTDGCATSQNGLTFCSVSKQLVEDMLWIVRSLGGYGQLLQQDRDDGRTRLYIVNPYLPDSVVPFRLTRKLERVKPRRCERSRSMASIEQREERVLMTCITVDAADGLFVLDDFIVTHNTAFTVEETLYNATKYGDVVLNWQAELSPDEIATMIAAQVLRKDRNTLTTEDKKQAAAELDGVKYYVGHNPSLTNHDEVLDLIEAAVKRLGATIVVLDTFHNVTASETNGTAIETMAANRIKNMAMKYKLKWVNVFQPRKSGQQSKGKKTHISDIRGAGAAADCADTVLAIHRDLAKHDDDMPADDIYEAKTLIQAQKTRAKGTGKAETYLMFYGCWASFQQIDQHREEPENINYSE